MLRTNKKVFLLFFAIAQLLWAQTPQYLFDSPQKGSATQQNGSNQYEYVVPSLRLTGTYPLREDFSDGNYSGWTVSSGSYAVNNSVANPLSTNQYSLVCNTAGIISIPCNQAYGRWEFDVYKGADANAFILYFMDSKRGVVADGGTGYLLYLWTTEQLYFDKMGSLTTTTLTLTQSSYISNTTWYHVTIERNTNGQFYVWIQGGAFTQKTLVSVTGGSGTNPITDNTYTSSNYFVLDLDAGDRISNISCEYGEGSLDLNSYEMIKKSFARDMELTSITSDDVTLGSDLLSGWDFTSGWTTSSATIDDSNSFTSTAFGGLIFKQVGITTVGKTYQMRIAGTTTSTRLQVINGAGDLFKDNLSGTFDVTFNFVWVGNLSLALRDYTVGNKTTDITTFTIQEVTALPYIGNGNHSVAISSTDKKSGTSSLAITATDSGDATTNYVSLPSTSKVDVVSGEKYTKEIWARGTGVLGSDLLSGWDFTSGWQASSSTIDDNNSFTSTAFGGLIFKTTGVNVIGKTYQIRIAGTTTSTRIQVINASGDVFKDNISGTFDITFYALWITDTRIALRDYTAGSKTTDITTFTVKEVTLPTITLALGSQSKSIANISCVPGTFTKLVWNFQATASEVGQPFKLYTNQADVVYVDDASLTQAYDALVSAWAYTSSSASSYIIMNRNASNFTYGIRKPSDKIRWSLYDGTNDLSATGATSINTSSWKLAQFKIDRVSNAIGYINGIQDATYSIINLGKINSTTLEVGAYTGTSLFAGNIGEVQITKFYDIAQSNVNASTLLSAYRWGLPKNWLNGIPVFNVKFRGSSLTQAGYDYSGMGNHLTFVNVLITDIIFGQGYFIK